MARYPGECSGKQAYTKVTGSGSKCQITAGKSPGVIF